MEYRSRTTITVNAEVDILKEIKELCEKERKSLSEKVNELFIGELEKKVKGSLNPLNVHYGIQEEKLSFGTLDQWLTRDKALKAIRAVKVHEAERAAKNIVWASAVVHRKFAHQEDPTISW